MSKHWIGESYAREHGFEKVAVNVDEWTSLYRCPSTRQYWKKFFPNPELHGGGPAKFERIEKDMAEKEFNVCLD